VLSLKGHKIPWNVILHTLATLDCKDKAKKLLVTLTKCALQMSTALCLMYSIK